MYILQSTRDNSYYTGVTINLKRRMEEHNSGGSAYSSTKSPYAIKWYGVFSKKEVAYDFEKYLKSSSGFAFRNKHLI